MAIRAIPRKRRWEAGITRRADPMVRAQAFRIRPLPKNDFGSAIKSRDPARLQLPGRGRHGSDIPKRRSGTASGTSPGCRYVQVAGC